MSVRIMPKAVVGLSVMACNRPIPAMRFGLSEALTL